MSIWIHALKNEKYVTDPLVYHLWISQLSNLFKWRFSIELIFKISKKGYNWAKSIQNAKACSNFTLITKNCQIIHNLADKCHISISLYFENLNQAKRVVFEPMNPTNYHFNLQSCFVAKNNRFNHPLQWIIISPTYLKHMCIVGIKK